MDYVKLFNTHVEKSFARLSEKDYHLESIFKDLSYDWPGDWEGRALLAFCNLYNIMGKKTFALENFLDYYGDRLNKDGFLGCEFNPHAIDEQQLSGHGWLLCGLLTYYQLFNDDRALNYAKQVVYNLYLKLCGKFSSYPINRENVDEGGVSGNLLGTVGDWKISTDVGCAFISLDGLSYYYSITKDEKVKDLLVEMIDVFMNIDKVALSVQTHATLTASRGILSFYKNGGGEKYLNFAIDLLDLYCSKGMTYTYENFNWFNKFDTWTEPCAVVDSLILATELFNITKKTCYKQLARRIWFNGLSYCHRANGGAGPNSCVYNDNNILQISMYEAPFCCNMRYASALVYVKNNFDLFNYNEETVSVDELGRHFVGDILMVKDASNNTILLTDLAFSDDNEEKYKVVY